MRFWVYRKGMGLASILYWAPRIMGILSILYISIFALDVFASGTPLPQMLLGLLIHLIPSFILAGFLALAWRFELQGGIAFIVISCIPFVLLSNPLWVNALLAAPFLLTGLLFVVHARMRTGVRS